MLGAGRTQCSVSVDRPFRPWSTQTPYRSLAFVVNDVPFVGGVDMIVSSLIPAGLPTLFPGASSRQWRPVQTKITF
jgi:hypothetical protein